MDPQLQAVRAAARERFLAKRTAGDSAPSVTPAEPRSAPSSLAALASLPPEFLEAPIAALLADGPPLERPPKRARTEDGLRVPPDKTAEIRRLLAQPAPNDMHVMSWNIDGLDEVGEETALMHRTLAVALEVARKRPVAVLLQEVVPPALELLDAQQVLGKAYEILVPENPPMPYYVAILLDRERAKSLGRPKTMPFPGSQMGRQILAVTISLPRGPPLLVATAHLESTKDHGPERKRQLAQSFRFLKASVNGATGGERPGAALLGGDLNLRDEEVRSVLRELGEDGAGVADAWSFCGSPENARYTWDTSENTNMGATFSCRTRFDRIYFVSPGVSNVGGVGGRAKSKAKAKAKAACDFLGKGASSGWRPVSFTLVGKEKVPSLGRFPSDHWGLLTCWSPTAEHAESTDPSTSSATGESCVEGGQSRAAVPDATSADRGAWVPAKQEHVAAGDGKLSNLKPGRVTIDLDD